MLRLKKAAEAAPAAAAAAGDAAPAADGGAGAGAGVAAAGAGAPAAGAVSLLGDEGRKPTAGGAKRKKVTPGEIRVQKDISELDAGAAGAVSWPDPADLTSLQLLAKPDQGFWKGGAFSFSIKVSSNYPHEAPKVMCLTPIYHPNIDREGHVCLNILRDDWKPIMDLTAVVNGLLYLFYEPNPNDPLNHEAAKLFREAKDAFRRNVDSSLRGGRIDGVTYPKQI